MPDPTAPFWIGDDHNLQARDHAVEARNVVKDHASGFQQEYRYVVEGRDIDGMIEARKRALMTQGEE